METDTLFPHLSNLVAACSLQAGPLFTTLKDLSLSIEWKDLRVLELPGTGWCAIVGHKRQEDALRAVIPLPLHTTSLNSSSLSAIFASLTTLKNEDLPDPIPSLVPDIASLRRDLATRRGHDPPPTADTDDTRRNEEIDRDMIYMGIVTSDSTVVYYKLTKGIKKPADIPDE